MSDLSHQQVEDAASVWLSKPFSSLVVQELSTESWGWIGRPKFILDVVGVTPNAQKIKIVECKTSRSDFKSGFEKLEIYQTFCHHLFVAAPTGMIQPEELPEGVGLLSVSQRGAARLKRWARPNQVDPAKYSLILERVLQKIIVRRSQSPWGIKRVGTEDKHWPGDGCEKHPTEIQGHLKHQDHLYQLAWREWLEEVEQH